MEEGSLRCDANVSVRPAGAITLGTKTEVKNINSFRFLQKALEYEIDRQIEIVEKGGHIVQETRLWDASSGETVSMRSKERAHDYRYFPEPDLPPLVVDAARLSAIRDSMPELPDARRQRLVAIHGLPDYDAAQLTQSRATADFFDEVVQAGATPKSASNWMMGELTRVLKEAGKDIADSPVSPRQLAALLVLVDKGTISGVTAKGVFEKMVTSGRTAADIVETEGLHQIDDDAELVERIAEVLRTHADAVAQYRSGKAAALGFLVGQVMKTTGGKANPKKVNELIRRELASR
jgi:aspartyl-tRNA(Asn)/glutamyl-tRNA(Gln) amidotransferase subunit B